MPDVNANALDLLLAGDLSHVEQRRLAQEALDDPELFDALTAAAFTQAALRDETSTLSEASRRVAVRGHRRATAIFAMLSAAAAVMLAVAYGWARWSDRPRDPAPIAVAPVAVPPPILLTARADPPNAQTFRSDGRPGRLPKDSGSVASVRDNLAEIDIGALDGLKQDMDLRILRNERRVGSITTTAVFRERARGRVESGDVRSGDRVEIDAAVTANAFLALATARRAAGDITGARELAARGVASADPASIPKESGELLNDLGVVQIERRDFAGAERTLQLAQSVAVGETRMRVANNLGAVAALRGDRTTASDFYRRAASLAGDSSDLAADRRAIEKNLATLQPPR